MKKVKMFICMAMAAALLCHTTTTVWAAVTHKEGCNNTTDTYNECGAFVAYGTSGSHKYYSVIEGDYVQCLKTSELHFHTVRCANSSCRAVYETNKVMPCIIRHNVCGDIETAVCKKQ